MMRRMTGFGVVLKGNNIRTLVSGGTAMQKCLLHICVIEQYAPNTFSGQDSHSVQVSS